MILGIYREYLVLIILTTAVASGVADMASGTVSKRIQPHWLSLWICLSYPGDYYLCYKIKQIDLVWKSTITLFEIFKIGVCIIKMK